MCIIKQTPQTDSLAKWTGITTALVVAIIIVLYAGFRYHTETAYELEGAIPGDSGLQFPAVTLCPLSPNGIPGFSAQYYSLEQYPNTFYPPNNPTVNIVPVAYRGTILTCIQYNNDPVAYESATDVNTAMVIQFYQNTTGVNPYLITGAVGALHVPGTIPVFNDAQMFYVPLGMTTQVAVLQYLTQNLAGFFSNQYFEAVPSTISEHPSNANSDVAQLILNYNEFIYYINVEYHVYTVWMWFGEVGGVACLFYLLQHAILWCVLACARRTCYRQVRRARPADPEAAVSKPAAQPVPSSSLSTSSSSRVRKPKRIKAVASPSESLDNSGRVTEVRRKKPQTQEDRIAIEMSEMDSEREPGDE